MICLISFTLLLLLLELFVELHTGITRAVRWCLWLTNIAIKGIFKPPTKFWINFIKDIINCGRITFHKNKIIIYITLPNFNFRNFVNIINTYCLNLIWIQLQPIHVILFLVFPLTFWKGSGWCAGTFLGSRTFIMKYYKLSYIKQYYYSFYSNKISCQCFACPSPSTSCFSFSSSSSSQTSSNVNVSIYGEYS